MRSAVVLSFVLLFFWGFAQMKYTVKDCIDLAVQNDQNTISQERLLQQSIVSSHFGKWSFLPTLSANSMYNSNYGRKIDPFSNVISLNVVNSISLGLSSQMTLFQGFRYFKQNKLFDRMYANAAFNLEKTKEQIKRQVIERCISIWKVEAKYVRQEKEIADLKKFKVRQSALVFEGRLRGLDTLTTVIHIKTLAVALLNIERELAIERIKLNFLIGLPLLNETKIEPIETTSSDFEISLDHYFELTEMKNQLHLEALQNKIDKTQFVPVLSFFGNMGTGFYSSNKDYSLPGQPVIPYATQFSNNAYQAVGFSLNIPLFNKGEYFKNQKKYALSKQAQEDLMAHKELEWLQRKLELTAQKHYLQEAFQLQNQILKDKDALLEAIRLLYLEGKIRLTEVEQEEAVYQIQVQTVQELEIELYKISRLKLD
jgi:outer membrane protein